MKHTGKCPKCQSTGILKIREDETFRDSGNYIPTGSFLRPTLVYVPRYVCRSCGYAEEWIEPEDIPRLIQKYN